MISNETYSPVQTVNPTVNPISKYNDENDVNEYGNRRGCGCRNKHYMHMYSVFHTIIALFAIYLSFKCNKGINVLDLLLALFCPVLYIVYRLAVCNETNILSKR